MKTGTTIDAYLGGERPGKRGRSSADKHPECCRVNTVLSNLKTANSGTYHHFNFAKYADRCLAEVQYRFNRRYDLRSILVRLVRAAVLTRPRPP